MPPYDWGGARGLMESRILDVGVSLQGGLFQTHFHLAKRVPAPGVLAPCSRAGNTPHKFQAVMRPIQWWNALVEKDVNYNGDGLHYLEL